MIIVSNCKTIFISDFNEMISLSITFEYYIIEVSKKCPSKGVINYEF